jgi:hypothetical protein
MKQTKTLKDYIQERTGRGKIIKKYRVPSKSQPNVFHLVEIDDKGNMFCDFHAKTGCIAGQMYKECSHIKIVKLWKK